VRTSDSGNDIDVFKNVRLAADEIVVGARDGEAEGQFFNSPTIISTSH
jgi:hypothetical protein